MDSIIPLSEAKLMLSDTGAMNKDIFIAEGADHNNIIMMIGNVYFQKIKKFIIDEK